MAIDFTPQFHRKLSGNGEHTVWVAVPHPGTLIPAKRAYYRTWQQEEWLRLTKAGEEVVALPVSH